MFILAFESHPEIPNRKSAFYKNVFDVLYSKHDGVTKGSFPREKRTKLKREDFEEVLSALSFSSIAEGKFAFTEEYLSNKLSLIEKKKRNISFEVEDLIFDLRTSISIMIKDGFEFKFPHRSLQEYFTASFLAALPTQKKAKAYTRLNNIFTKSSVDNSLNLWKLCKELDYANYYKHFVLPELSQMLKELDYEGDLQLLNAFLRTVSPYLALIRINGMEKHKLYLIHSSKPTKALIKDENIFKESTFDKFLFKYQTEILDSLNFKFNSNTQTNSEHIIITVSNDLRYKRKLKSLIIELGFMDIVRSFRTAIEFKIEEIKRNLSSDDDDLDELLEG
jgi:hypothetical protein